MYPYLKRRVEKSSDRLLMAIRCAIAGNIIDFGAYGSFDLSRDVEEILEKDFAVFDYTKFKYGLDKAHQILYLGDNAGECVFDRILIEEIKKPVNYVVRDAPIINDATYEDAVQAGIDGVATNVSSGTDAPGTILETCTAEFRNIYQNSKFIISKGQGNYEALSNETGPTFFLLKAKCKIIADDFGIDEGEIVLKRSKYFSAHIKKIG